MIDFPITDSVEKSDAESKRKCMKKHSTLRRGNGSSRHAQFMKLFERIKMKIKHASLLQKGAERHRKVTNNKHLMSDNCSLVKNKKGTKSISKLKCAWK